MRCGGAFQTRKCRRRCSCAPRFRNLARSTSPRHSRTARRVGERLTGHPDVAVFIEGDCPIDYVDLSVFVAPVPSRGTRCSDGSFVLRSNRKGQTDQTIARPIQASVLRGPATPSWLCPSRSDPAATGRCLGGAAAALAAAGWAATPARLAAHRASPLTCYTAP